MTQPELANSGIEKFVEGYKYDPSLRRHIDEWDERNDLVRRLKEAIQLKAEQPELKHAEPYPHHILQEALGALTIVGLSPTNDNHLFQKILENEQVAEIEFFYYNEGEANEAKKLFNRKEVRTRDVRDLWTELDTMGKK